MIVRFLSIAEEEFADAAEFYEEQSPGLGGIFIEQIKEAVEYLRRNPFAGVLIDKRVRKAVTTKFPYNVVYFPSASELVILAIAHHKREPLYWRDRIEGLQG
ncbi:MAG: type II toxin-antitoxin system RelE/ParE family toxin [Chloracidobacterium sp.]|nr:type II toxin-antitoxin system RelE/ParE family toxin [Chloracidobacterium sp.]